MKKTVRNVRIPETRNGRGMMRWESIRESLWEWTLTVSRRRRRHRWQELLTRSRSFLYWEIRLRVLLLSSPKTFDESLNF